MTTKEEAKWISDLETLKKHRFEKDDNGFLKYTDKASCEYMRVDLKNADKHVDIENEKIRKEKGLNKEDIEKEEFEKKIIIKKFKGLELMNDIMKEIGKKHLGDYDLKKTALYIAISSMLSNPNLRQSCALTGDSSVGKDNLIKTIFQHMPNSLFLTGATQSSMEDEAMYCKLLGLSEMNLFREHGANKNLLEVVKQRTEGGINAMKKNVEDNFKTTKREITEQGTTFYGTTEAERNKEMETRFIFLPVTANEKKVEEVNKNTAQCFEDPEKLIESSDNENSWIKKGLQILEEKNQGCKIIIPFANVLVGKNKQGENIIDTSNPRSMRDLKRIYALICARTWLFSEQRKKIMFTSKKTDTLLMGKSEGLSPSTDQSLVKTGCQKQGVNLIESNAEDMIEVIKDTKNFFNQTYTGMDERLSSVLKIIKECDNEGGWIARDFIQEKLGKSRNTIKEWCSKLSEEGLIIGTKGNELNTKDNFTSYDSNKIYYKGCQKGINRVLIRCEENELKELIKEYIKNITHKKV